MDRRTRSGFVLGPEERISVEEALHAVTLGAAYAYFEEDRKGSITPGKQADLVVLGADPRRGPRLGDQRRRCARDDRAGADGVPGRRRRRPLSDDRILPRGV